MVWRLGHLSGVYANGLFVPNQVASNVARLYYRILERAPDAAGLTNATTAAGQGRSLHDIAQNMLDSAEYQVLTTGLTTAGYAEALYVRLLGRTGDPTGLQSWTAALNAGVSRTTVADAFVESPEYQGNYAGQNDNAYVSGLYRDILGRSGETGGVEGWVSALASHSVTRTGVADGFVSSPEFQGKYVAPSDATFVERLYEGALGRHADAAGAQHWTTALAAGMSRTDVALSISGSPEAGLHLLPLVENGFHLA